MAETPTNMPAMLENPDAPIVYADLSLGGGFMNGDNVTITFGAKVLDHTVNPPGSNMKVVLRLVMPAAALNGTADFIKEFLGSPSGSGPAPAANAKMN